MAVNASRHPKSIFYAFTFPLIAVLLGLAIYQNTFTASFQFDDIRTIAENSSIKHLTNTSWMWFFDPSRFLTYFSFALNYHFGQLDVRGYHIMNFILHLLVAGCVYLFLTLTFSSVNNNPSFKNKISLTAFFSTLIFLSHPIQTAAVTYVSQRSTLLAALFYLSSLNFYILYRRRKNMRYYILSMAAAFWGIFSKPIIITLPFAVLLYEIFFLDFSWRKDKKRLLGLIPFCLVIIAVPVLLILWKYKALDFGKCLEITSETTAISRKDYLLTQFNVLMTYLRLLAFPVHQNLDYDYPIVKSFFSFPTYLSFGALVLLFLYAVEVYRKDKFTSFAIFWFFLTLSLESSFFPISDVIFEHRLYLPMVGFVLALPVSLERAVRSRFIVTSILTIAVLVFSVMAYQRNHLWSDRIGILLDTVKKSPHKSRPHNNLGYAYQELGYLNKAEEEYKKAIILKDDYAFPHNNLGNIYKDRGKIDEAIREFERAIALKNDYEGPYYNLGNIYLGENDSKKAEAYFLKALSIRPNFVYAYIGLGNVYLARGDIVTAKFYFNQAASLSPDFVYTRLGLATVFLNQGKYDDALEEYKKAIKQKPMTIAYNNIGNILDIQGRYAEAVEYYNMAIAQDRRFANAYFNLSNTFKKMRRFKESRQKLEIAIRLFKEQNNVKMVHLAQKRLQELAE